MRLFLSSLLLVLQVSFIGAQPKCTFTHYSVEDGLSEGEVLSMHQDRNGFMWFGTFDGLNRFDGANFKVYKSGFNKYTSLINNRIDKIFEDDYGYLWTLSNNGDVHRFDTQYEKFLNVKGTTQNISNDQSPIQQIFCFSGGETWLTTEQGGCIKVISDVHSDEIKLTYYRVSEDFQSSRINTIFKDKRNDLWILSSIGLYNLRNNKEKIENVSNAINSKANEVVPFFSFFESDNSIWFGSSQGRIITYNIENDSFESFNLGVKSNVISIKQLNQRELIVLTSNDGFVILNKTTGDKRFFNKDVNSQITSNKMISVYIDKFGEAWIESSIEGVLHFDPFTSNLKHIKPKTDKTNPNVFLPNFFIFEDKNDNLWVHPLGGGFSLYNRKTKELQYFHNEPGNPSRRFPNILHSAYCDHQGNLWLCTISRGIEKITFFSDNFKLIQPKPGSLVHSENEVRFIFEDKSKILWIATKDGLVHLFDSTKTNLGILRENGSLKSGNHLNGLIYTIIQDRKGCIWMGSKGRGVFKLENIGTKKSPCFKITNYTHNQDDPFSLSHDNIFSLFEDTYGRIWVGTYGGGLNYISEESDKKIRFINYGNNMKKYPFVDYKRIRYITSDFQNNIWVATTNGVLVFKQNFTNSDSISFKTYTCNPEDNQSLSNNNVNYIYCSRDNDIYISTFGGGLNKVIKEGPDLDKIKFKSFTEATGAPSDIILCIVDDLNGNLWLSTERGILKFYKSSLSFENYGKQSGIDSKYFSEASGIRIHTGEVMMGFDNGLFCFNPDQVRKSNYIPKIIITGIQVGGKDILSSEYKASKSYNDPDFVLDIHHKAKVFSIGYASLDYLNPNNIQYAIKLKGFDKDWKIERGQKLASYTNLAPGEYQFKVKSTNSDGVWADNEKTINIVVHPSFWETKMARILYAIVFLLLTFITIYIVFTIYKLRHKVEVEQLITNMKLKFFTDISHELRTPLTLISSPVENIIKNYSLEPEIKEQLTIVNNNVDRMLRLVNQILDFRKIQNKKMRLKVEEFGLGGFIAEIVENFKKVAIEKGISLVYKDFSDNEMIWADKDKVEKIAYNLLANALKFTPKDKSVQVSVLNENGKIILKVADQGIGLPKEKMRSIFERFVSSDNSKINFQPSTGIGLSLCKELTDLHKADLLVDSKEGEGTTFTVLFNYGRAHFENDTDFILSDGSYLGSDVLTLHGKHDEDLIHDDDDLVPVLLIVEDNEELRSFLRLVLSSDFHVIEASNGKEGLQIAYNQLPDIIITDIMMPEMDGLNLAEKIKTNETTSHIPVVVLTAKTDLDTQVEALKTGADDYITKPFSSTYLRARIENIINQRKKLHEQFLSNLSLNSISHSHKTVEIEPSKPVIESYDDKLLAKLMDIMEKNMDNAELTVDELVSKIGIGRSVFFKKLKSLTGLAPIEFIREVRIKRAAQLIESGQFTVSQVTFMVGNNDPRYFSRCFKQRFGMTPSEYKEKYSLQK